MRLLPLDITMTATPLASARASIEKGGLLSGVNARIKIAAALVFATPVAILYHTLGVVVKALILNKDCAKHLENVYKLAVGVILLAVGLLTPKIGLDIYAGLNLNNKSTNTTELSAKSILSSGNSVKSSNASTTPDAPQPPPMSSSTFKSTVVTSTGAPAAPPMSSVVIGAGAPPPPALSKGPFVTGTSASTPPSAPPMGPFVTGAGAPPPPPLSGVATPSAKKPDLLTGLGTVHLKKATPPADETSPKNDHADHADLLKKAVDDKKNGVKKPKTVIAVKTKEELEASSKLAEEKAAANKAKRAAEVASEIATKLAADKK